MAALDPIRGLIGGSQRSYVLWPGRVGCACAGVLVGVLLRFGVDTPQAKLLPFKNAETRVPPSSAPLPPSLQTIETELQRTLVSGWQTEEDLAAQERWLQTFVQQLAPGDFAEAARHGLQLPAKLRRSFLLSVIGRWAEWKGAEAIAFVERFAPEELRQALVEEALDRWANTDSSGALNWIVQQAEDGKRLERLERFIRTVEGNSPAAALDALEKLPRSIAHEAKRQELARRLAEHDFPAALTSMLHGWQDYAANRETITDLAALWLDKDPAAAMAWVAQLPSPDERRAFELHLASAWARKDVQAVLEWVNSQPAASRSLLLSGVMEQWAMQDPNAAKEYALALQNSGDRTSAILNITCQLALTHKDLSAALELHKQLGSAQEKIRVQLFRDLVARVDNDYRVGAEILRDLPPNEENLRLIDRYIARWVWDDGAAVGQFLKENDLTDKLPEAAQNYALQLSRKASDAALTWARELPPGASRDNALCGAVYGLAEQDPARAANLLREISASLQPDAARAVADQWFGKDPERATAWARSLANEQSRTLACASIVESWSSKDPTGPVVQWIESLPPGPTYDVAVTKYAKSVSTTDPEAGIAWIATIGDSQLRQLQAEDYTRRWLQYNRQDAVQWIEQTELLSSATKQQLLSENAH